MMAKHYVLDPMRGRGLVVKTAIIALALLSVSCNRQQAERPGQEQAAAAAILPKLSTEWFTSNPDADTFRISTADELAGLANIVNRIPKLGQGRQFDFSGRTIILAEDIDLSHYGKSYRYTIDGDEGARDTVCGWIPVGEKFLSAFPGAVGKLQSVFSGAFSGTFDGNGKTIRGLYIEGPISEAGLFGWIVNGGIVKNLTLEDVNINAESVIGAVAGKLYGEGSKVINCSSAGTVHGIDYVGGVAGGIGEGAAVSNSHFKGAVRGKEGVGGVVGIVVLNSRVDGCYFTGAVSGTGGTGRVLTAEIDLTDNTAFFSPPVSGASMIGGVAGTVAANSHVADSYSTGTVSGERFVGGVAGNIEDNSSVTGSYSASAVRGDIEQGIGGVAGRVGGSSAVSNCHSTGDVSGGHVVGGVAGGVMGESKLSNCYATGKISGQTIIGGVAGMVTDGGSVVNCYSVSAVSGEKAVGGVVGIIMGGNGAVTGCAALNPSVIAADSSFGRVRGETHGNLKRTMKLSNNIAFSGMTNAAGSTLWPVKTPDTKNGADITAAAINAGGTLDGRFTSENGWAVQPGSLPGFGKPAAMPPHLQVK